jgi:8-oxo-dGTP pyrophosphatase MutT (NUDIX family)
MQHGSIDILFAPPRRQIAALPLRERAGWLEICLVTTRSTHRWTLPKGWPIKGCKDHVAARIEAEEEAGVTGRARKKAFGSFLAWKRQDDSFERVEVNVHPMEVTGTLRIWKEQTERRVQWMRLRDAVNIVDDPGLAGLLAHFSNRAGGRM